MKLRVIAINLKINIFKPENLDFIKFCNSQIAFLFYFPIWSARNFHLIIIDSWRNVRLLDSNVLNLNLIREWYHAIRKRYTKALLLNRRYGWQLKEYSVWQRYAFSRIKLWIRQGKINKLTCTQLNVVHI